jgi:hypothetical protein
MIFVVFSVLIESVFSRQGKTVERFLGTNVAPPRIVIGYSTKWIHISRPQEPVHFTRKLEQLKS